MYVSHDSLLLLKTCHDNIPCLLAVFSLLGTALLYPGWEQVAFAHLLLDKPPFLSGLGPNLHVLGIRPHFGAGLCRFAFLDTAELHDARRRPFLQGALGESMLLQ